MCSYGWMYGNRQDDRGSNNPGSQRSLTTLNCTLFIPHAHKSERCCTRLAVHFIPNDVIPDGQQIITVHDSAGV